LAEIYIPITVPLLPVAPKPTLTTSGSHNSPTNNVRINGVAPGGGYIYHLGTQVGSGAWKWENANAGAIVTKPQVANNKVRYRARCQTVGSTSWTYSDPTGYFYGHASAPTGLSASYSGGAVKLAWNLNTFEPSRVDVGRSSNPDMSGGRIIYSGKAISTFEDNSPPAGNVYYRVATYPAYSTSAAAGVTGIAAAQTMTPPAPISNVINNGNISFSWTNNSNPTISPYAFLRVYSSAGGHDDVTGDTTVYYPDIPDASDAYFEVVAHNGAGVSTPARAGYFSGEPETPNLTIDDATGKDISILVSPSPDSYDSGRAINRTTIVYLSDSNVLVEIGRVSGGGGVITYEAPTDGLYRFSAETVVSFDDFGYEMSSGMSSEIVANIEFAPKSVLSIAYDDASNLITVSLPEDYAGRELNVSVDGNIVGTYTVGGDAQSIDTAFTPFKPHFVISANITNNYSDDTTVTKSQAVILGDYIPVIGGSKYLVKIIDSSGSRYAKVKLI
jgi:hypothetical protein